MRNSILPKEKAETVSSFDGKSFSSPHIYRASRAKVDFRLLHASCILQLACIQRHFATCMCAAAFCNLHVCSGICRCMSRIKCCKGKNLDSCFASMVSSFRWLSGGCQVAASMVSSFRWLSRGCQVAVRWLSGGCKVAYRWLQGGLQVNRRVVRGGNS